jgi:hypothetical protein
MPAITIVEECRRAETGVGAAIAAISHDEKGHTADLVKKTTAKRHSTASPQSPYKFKTATLKLLYWWYKRLITSKKHTSPSLLYSNVLIPQFTRVNQ